jgi:hypothetical protein
MMSGMMSGIAPQLRHHVLVAPLSLLILIQCVFVSFSALVGFSD